MKAKLRKNLCLLGETLMCSLAGARTHTGRRLPSRQRRGTLASPTRHGAH